MNEHRFLAPTDQADSRYVVMYALSVANLPSGRSLLQKGENDYTVVDPVGCADYLRTCLWPGFEARYGQ